MIPTCYCQDLQASALWISSMYLFTQPIFLPRYFPVCVAPWLPVFSLFFFFFFRCLFLSLPPRLPSLTHPPPFSPSSPHSPPHSFAHRLSFSDAHTHAHKHTQRHMLCLAGSEPLTTVAKAFIASIKKKKKTKTKKKKNTTPSQGYFCRAPLCLGMSPILDSLWYDEAF